MFGYVVATKRLIELGGPVRFMYREIPSNDDSGWRFFAGDEDNNYLSDPDNIGIYDISSILAIDTSVEPYLNNGPWVAYERNDDGIFVEVEDFWPQETVDEQP